MSNWSTSNYRSRKAQRLNNLKPEWVENPETQERFLLRKVGGMAYTIAGHMPHALTAEAVQGWREQGVEVESDNDETKKIITSKEIAEGTRNLQLMARVVQDACVLPKLVSPAVNDDELDPAELDDSDLLFIFRYATGQVGSNGVPMQGGQVMNMADLKSARKKPGIRSRTGTGG